MVYGDTVATTTDPSKQCKDNEDYYMCKPVCLQYCTIGHSACADYCEVGCDCKAKFVLNFKRVNGTCVSMLSHCAGHGGFLECNNKTCGVNKTKPLINYVCVKTVPRICTWS
ncbi:hypothetical protein L596_013803 [Steinernema carpocapsae]|nr:hypothetical protein L596_013803 [Steinernema carpocapsae]